MFCQSKKKKKDEEKGVYCPIAQKTIQPPKTGLNFESLVFFPKSWGNYGPGHFYIDRFGAKLTIVPK